MLSAGFGRRFGRYFYASLLIHYRITAPSVEPHMMSPRDAQAAALPRDSSRHSSLLPPPGRSAIPKFYAAPEEFKWPQPLLTVHFCRRPLY